MRHGLTIGSLRRARRSPWWVPVAVIAVIAALVLVPVRDQLLPDPPPDIEPLTFQRLPPAPRIPAAATQPAEASPRVRTLVLYDRSGKWGWLGELYATLTANFVSHFGRWDAKPVAEYEPGDVDRYTALVYVGSTYGERLPDGFLDDVLGTSRPVIWVNDNILELAARAGDFAGRYGWRPTRIDRSPVSEVRYEGRTLTRWSRDREGIMRGDVVDPRRAHVLATAVPSHGRPFPWAIRARNLTYVGEVPFTYTSETDRVLAFADLLFDALAPRTPERHRALVRLEDINPLSDPDQLRAAADYLHSKGIPFGFGLSPYYRDPQGHDDPPHELLLHEAPELLAALKYLERKGGVLVAHGYTHQWDGGRNPYNGVTGDDVEFYRVTETADGDVQPRGPLPGDRTMAWTEHRIVAANRELAASGLTAPKIFEFPHYFASVRAYRAAARWFSTRWERGQYFAGLLSGSTIRHDRVEGQFFPYVVRDVYGTKVLPENLGSISPKTWHSYKARRPADVIRAARANLVVRDGFAAFYFHPFLDLDLLKQTVEGIEKAGYEFVDPASL